MIFYRANLREGARVLVDEDDRETYDLVLSGDYVPGESINHKIYVATIKAIGFVIHNSY